MSSRHLVAWMSEASLPAHRLEQEVDDDDDDYGIGGAGAETAVKPATVEEEGDSQPEGEHSDSVAREDAAGFVAKLLFHDFSPLLKVAAQRQVQVEDVGPLPAAMRSDALLPAFQAGWNSAPPEARAAGSSAAVRRALWCATKRDAMVFVVASLLLSAAPFANPLLLDAILGTLSVEGEAESRAIVVGLVLAFSLFVANTLEVLLYVTTAVSHTHDSHCLQLSRCWWVCMYTAVMLFSCATSIEQVSPQSLPWSLPCTSTHSSSHTLPELIAAQARSSTTLPPIPTQCSKPGARLASCGAAHWCVVEAAGGG